MPIPPIPTKCTCLMRLNMMQDHYVFPSAQRRGGCAERSKGADGVVRPAKYFSRTDHPGALRHPPLRGGECVCLPSLLNRSFPQIHDALFGIENSHPPGIAFDLFQPLRIPNQLKNRRGKAFSLEFGVG